MTTASGLGGSDVFYIRRPAAGQSYSNVAIDGGSGLDLVDFRPYNMGANILLDDGQPAFGDFKLVNVEYVILADGNNSVIAGAHDDTVIGGAGADSVHGGGGKDLIAGLGGDDRLFGDGGDDLFDGGLGNDLMDGGDGVDGVDYSASAVGVTIDLNLTGPQQTGFGSDTLVSIEQLFGTPFNDRFIGTAADELFEGYGGSDVYVGGAGNDIAVVTQSVSGAALDFGADGTLTVSSAGQVNTFSGVELITFADGGVFTAPLRAIRDAYAVIMGRAATGSELSYWTGQVHGGQVSEAGVAATLASSFEGNFHVGELIYGLYHLDLGRPATSAEYTYWSGALRSGAVTPQSMLDTFATLPGAPAQARVAVAQLYETWLGREPSVAETGYWTTLLQGGTLDYAQAEGQFSRMPGAAGHQAGAVVAAYRDLAGRDPTQAEAAYWNGELSTVRVAPSDLRSALLGSAEGAAHVSGAVGGFYTDLIGHTASDGERTYWVGRVKGGESLDQVRGDLLDTAAGLAHTTSALDAIYEHHLGRDPSAGELAYWNETLHHGVSFAQIDAAVGASPAVHAADLLYGV